MFYVFFDFVGSEEAALRRGLVAFCLCCSSALAAFADCSLWSLFFEIKEEICWGDRQQSKTQNGICVSQYFVLIQIYLALNEQKYKDRKTLYKLKYTKRVCLAIEFITENLKAMSIYDSILQAPYQRSHVGKDAKLTVLDIFDGSNGCPYQYYHVDANCFSWRHCINYSAHQDGGERWTNSKEHQGKLTFAQDFIFMGLVIFSQEQSIDWC